jgi:serine protease Do
MCRVRDFEVPQYSGEVLIVDNMDFNNGNENTGMGFNMNNTDFNSVSQNTGTEADANAVSDANDGISQMPADFEPQKNGYISFQSVPVKKSRFKKFIPIVACSLISAILGGAAGGAYVGYRLGDSASTGYVPSGSTQSGGKIVGYTPSNNLITNIAEAVGPSVVGVNTQVVQSGFFGQKQVAEGSGSGIIFDANGLIVTNQHVIANADPKNITVTLPGGKNFKAKVVGSDSVSDLAVLKINAANLPAAKLGDSSKLRVGDLAVAIGNPMGEAYAGSVTSGIISALNRKMYVNDDGYSRRYTLIQTDAAINPGNSGGALINQNGEVIGINTIKIADSEVEGMGFAIPISEARIVIDQLLKNGYVSRPYLGVEAGTVDEQTAKDYNTPVGAGIETVIRGGAAEKAGIMPGDIIVEVDGTAIKGSEDLIYQLEKHKAGDSIKIKLWRDGKDVMVTATLNEMTNPSN